MSTKNKILDVYTRSKEIEYFTGVDITDTTKILYSQLLLCGEKAKERQIMANLFCIELCRCFKIKRPIEVRVCNSPQDSTVVNGVCVSRILGKYIPSQRMCIIFNKTAVRKNIVSIKVFADALLHEFIHYIDHEYYGFNTSPHTSGFYNRLCDLKLKLNKGGVIRKLSSVYI